MNRASQFLSLLIKLMVVVAIIGVGIIIYQSCSGTALIQKIDKTLPDTTIAHYEVSTVIKNYLAQRAVANDDGSVTMYNWYDRNNNKWVYHAGIIIMPPVLRPRIISR